MSRFYLTLLLMFNLLTLSFFCEGAEEQRLFNLTESARFGDYIVYLQGKTYTLLRMGPTEGKKLYFEEISIPIPLWERYKNLGWKGWIEQEAPSHSSWIVYAFSPGEEETQAYSRSRNIQFVIPKEKNLFLTLLELHFEKIPPNKRRRMGPTSTYSGLDNRPIWNPSLKIEGKAYSATFQAWKGKWPKDDTDLSGLKIEVYLPNSNPSLSPFPNYLPFWVQTGSGVTQAKVQAVDCGIGMTANFQTYGI